MKLNWIVIFVIVFLILVSVPTYLWMRDYNFSLQRKIDSAVLSNYFSSLSAILSFSSLTISFILLNVAIKAARNFDVKKQFHNKQFQVVCDLAQEILNTKVKLRYYHKSKLDGSNAKQIRTGYLINFYLFPDFLKDKQIFSVYKATDIDEIIPFLRYRYNPLTPKVISTALGNLSDNLIKKPLIYDAPDEIMENLDISAYIGARPDEYMLLLPNIDDANIFEDWSDIYFDDQEMFRLNCENVRQALLKWFKVYGAEDINI